MRKRIKEVVSGDLIVTKGGRWDRVHGVSDAKDGIVTVNSDQNHAGTYPSGTIVNTA